jgi:hypothetical protein
MAEVRFPMGGKIFLFSIAFILPLGPTQHIIQWVPQAISLGVKWQGHEADHLHQSVAKISSCGGVLPLPNTSKSHAQLVKYSDSFLPF